MKRHEATSQRAVPEFTLASPLATLVDRGPQGARLRLALMVAGLGLYWFLVTLFSDFPPLLPASLLGQYPPLIAALLDALTSFFAPPVLIFLLPVLSAIGLAFFGASAYLTDLFELESPSIALRYLLGAILGLSYPSLAIHSGNPADLDQRNPLLRIGGPGYLILHLGFAAVFETPTGEPRIYGQSRSSRGQPFFIQGFERLREIVDLRDQLRRLDEVRTVTRDGIEVYARDVQIVFRAYSSEKRSMQHPYPFDPKSILALVYGRIISESGPGRWTDSLPELAAEELRRFVANRTLEEFLAMRGEGGLEVGGSSSSLVIPRRELAQSFHTPERQERLKEAGLELVWVGVGTWEVRDDQIRSTDTELAAGRTLTATLRDQARARRLRSPDHLNRERKLSALAYSKEVFDELARTWSQGHLPADFRCFEVLERIKRRLIEFQRQIEELQGPDPSGELQLPEGFQESLLHLESMTDRSPSF